MNNFSYTEYTSNQILTEFEIKSLLESSYSLIVVVILLAWLLFTVKDLEVEHFILGIVCFFFFWHEISHFFPPDV